MATSPEHHQDFRAPPPSPIGHASTRRLINEDEISEFLEHSLRVPNLILPDQIFPKETQVKNLPEINFKSLISSDGGTVAEFLESIGGIGCVQLVNHGISGDLIRSVSIAAAEIFGLPQENKKAVSRSPEVIYGFEELEGEEEMETSEEFVWCRDEGLKSVMEGIRLQGFSNFNKVMEDLSIEVEEIAYQVLSTLLEHSHIASTKLANIPNNHDLVCYLHKHHRYTSTGKSDGSLKSDFIRMLIRGSADYSHALCIHLCDYSSEFHVYSKKGWISFTPSRYAILVTVGDQIQEWSGGKYRNVIGRPIFKVDDQEPISMAFLFSPPTITKRSSENREKIISLQQQLIFALFLTLIYHIFLFLYKLF